MTRKVIDIDHKKCTGCRACMLTCSLAHAGEIRLAASAIQIASSNDEGRNVPLVCIACEERPCLDVCPEDAIHLHEELDMPMIDSARCTGCQSCIAACPYCGIFFDPVAKKAVKCDLCNGEPLCVKVCTGVYDMPAALRYVIHDAAQKEEYGQSVQDRMEAYQMIQVSKES